MDCKTTGLKDAWTRLQTVYFTVLYDLFSMVCVLMKILSDASAKKKTKMLKAFRFRTFMGRFEMTS